MGGRAQGQEYHLPSEPGRCSFRPSWHVREIAGGPRRLPHWKSIPTSFFPFQNHPLQLRFVDPRQFGRLFWEKADGRGSFRPSPGWALSPWEYRPWNLLSGCGPGAGRSSPSFWTSIFWPGWGTSMPMNPCTGPEFTPEGNPIPCRKETSIPAAPGRAGGPGGVDPAKGTSVRSYVDAAGSTGAFQNFLRVYGREGEPCGSVWYAHRSGERWAEGAVFSAPDVSGRPGRRPGRVASPSEKFRKNCCIIKIPVLECKHE